MARIITAFVLFVIGFGALFSGEPLYFFAFVEVVALLCLIEFYSVLKRGGEPSLNVLGVIAGLLFISIVNFDDGSWLMPYMAGMVIVTFTASILAGGENLARTGTNTLTGVIYIGGTLAVLPLIRNVDNGELYICMLIVATSFCDIFSLYTGKLIGKRALAPKISPNKTVEGAIGGVVGAIVGTIGTKFLMLPLLDMYHTLAIGVIIGLFCPMGDLTESALKRSMGVKDAGWILPGHGGMLDRADAIMFSGAAFYIYLKLVLIF